jgi:hypothetical protein
LQESAAISVPKECGRVLAGLLLLQDSNICARTSWQINNNASRFFQILFIGKHNSLFGWGCVCTAPDCLSRLGTLQHPNKPPYQPLEVNRAPMRRWSRQQQPALLAALSIVLVALASTAYAQDCLPGMQCFLESLSQRFEAMRRLGA